MDKDTQGQWLELDLYQYAENTVQKFIGNLRSDSVDGGPELRDLRRMALGGKLIHPLLYNISHSGLSIS